MLLLQPQHQQKKKSTKSNNFSGVCFLINILANGFECFIYYMCIHYNDDGINGVRGQKLKTKRIYTIVPSLNKIIM